MFNLVSKFVIFLVLITCLTVINGFSKRRNADDDNESLKDLEALEKEMLSTVESMVEKMDEKLAEDLENEKEEFNEKVTEAIPSDEQEPLEETGSKSSDEAEKQEEEEKEKNSLAEETPKLEVPSSTTKQESSENEETPSSTSPTHVTELSIEKEKGPEDTFIVWNTKGKVCLLAKFHVVFSITYPSKGGEQKAEVTVPKHGTAKGKCETATRSPLLQISWQKYVFTMMFNMTDEDSWIVTSIELTYDTSDTLFDGATSAGKKTARSKALNSFETPIKKSFYCPAEEVVFLYSSNKQVVTARLRDVYLQPYGVEDGKFSPAQRCSKVVLDGPDESPYVQDETVPLAVGCTLALITLLILLGFSFHRAYNAAKVDYNTME